LHRRTTGHIHARNRWAGHLWQARFGSVGCHRNSFTLAPVYSASVIDPIEIGDFGFTKRAERRKRPAAGHRLADANLGVGNAALFRGLQRGRRGSKRHSRKHVRYRD
jgi:hypothetical protein